MEFDPEWAHAFQFPYQPGQACRRWCLVLVHSLNWGGIPPATDTILLHSHKVCKTGSHSAGHRADLTGTNSILVWNQLLIYSVHMKKWRLYSFPSWVHTKPETPRELSYMMAIPSWSSKSGKGQKQLWPSHCSYGTAVPRRFSSCSYL